MGAECLVWMMKMLWKSIVAMYHLCMHLMPRKHTIKNDRNGIFYVMYIFAQLKILTKMTIDSSKASKEPVTGVRIPEWGGWQWVEAGNMTLHPSVFLVALGANSYPRRANRARRQEAMRSVFVWGFA